MRIIAIEGKEYEVYEIFKDVKLKDFIRITEWASKNMPTKLKDFMFPKENEHGEDYKKRVSEITFDEKDEKEIDNFKVEYISEVVGWTKEKVMTLRYEDDAEDDSWSVMGMFNHLCFILFLPEQKEGFNKLTINGKDYFMQPNMEQKIGQKPSKKLRKKGLTFGEHIELTTMNQGFKPFGWGSYEYLDLFLAVMYRPMIRKEVKWYKRGFSKMIIEPYNQDACTNRREIFQEINMELAFGATFFLFNSLNTYKKHILESFNEVQTQFDLKDLAKLVGI